VEEYSSIEALRKYMDAQKEMGWTQHVGPGIGRVGIPSESLGEDEKRLRPDLWTDRPTNERPLPWQPGARSA
jgi:hypothetical protein